MCKALTFESKESSEVEQACLLAIKGHVKNIDVTIYDIKGIEKPVYSFLCFFWAIVSDIDLESEKIRWIGSSRFTIWSILRCLKLRRYSGMLEYEGVDILNSHQKVKKVETTDSNSMKIPSDMEDSKGDSFQQKVQSSTGSLSLKSYQSKSFRSGFRTLKTLNSKNLI